MKVAISRINYPVYALGPGKRVAIWFQGCSIRCKGCISVDTWDKTKNQIELTQVLELLAEWLPQADGLTISGGEPFDQTEQLKCILEAAKKHNSINTFVYTGRPFEDITQQLQDLNGLIDAIMTDPLDNSLPQTLPLRGSDNQRLFALTQTGLGIREYIENLSQDDLKVLDLSYSQNEAYISGVTKRADIVKLVSNLKSQGTQTTTFEDTRVNRSKLS